MGSRKRENEWEVIRLRSKGEYLGTVKAKDQGSALKAAIKTFALRRQDEPALLIRPR